MIRLAPGTPKYLLIDTEVVARNKERQKKGDAIVRVVEMHPSEGEATAFLAVLRGYDVLVNGSTTLRYSQNTPLCRVRLRPEAPDQDVYAAFYTTDEVLIAESHEEVLAASPSPEELPKAASDNKAKTKK